MIIRKSYKAIMIVIASILLFAVILYGYYASFIDPARDTVSEPMYTRELDAVLTKAQAQRDLKYMMKMLREHHPAYLENANSKVDIMEDAYEDELTALGENVTVKQLWQAAGRIEAKLGDAHTSVYINSEAPLYISDFTRLNNGEIPISINGISYELLLEKFKKTYSYETEEYAEAEFCTAMIIRKNYLELCGIDTTRGADFTYRTDSGEITEHYDFVTADLIDGRSESNDKWVYYTVDEEKNLAVLTLTSCNNNDEYKRVLSSFFGTVKQKGITNIAVDLRENGGGNSSVANEFLTYVDVDCYSSWESESRYGPLLIRCCNGNIVNEKKSNAFSGNLYVLTATETFSSAMDFAMLVGDNNIGTLVGEASGNIPDGYGDCLTFQMPESGLVMSVSYKRWYRIDQSKTGELITPDYAVEGSAALEKVYELISV